ncbi:MAG TPA: guanylate kinase [Pyrinomonadaceae bacterium]|nr:guanylate kinase [Pyrinomonadaceae bacterium]
MKGNLIIISSPSGGGKGTLIHEVRGMLPELGFSVSHTTRPMRFGEEEGREYYFLDRHRFEQKAAAGEFIEYAIVHGNLYGTSVAEVEKWKDSGKDLIVEVDVQGAISILQKMPDCVSIFILPPSFEVLEARLTSRATEDAKELKTRLRNSFREVQEYTRFKYVVVNDNIAGASQQIASIIRAERQLLDRQSPAIQGILDSFEAARPRFE